MVPGARYVLQREYDMLVNSDAETNQTASGDDQRLTPAELHLVMAFRQLSEEHRNDMLRFIAALLNAQ